MWLGDSPLSDKGKIIELSEYLTRRERRVLSSDLKKGLPHPTMNYLPFTYTKELKEFPSNPELTAAGFTENTAVIATKLKGDQELAIGELSSLEKPDPNDPAKMVSAFTGAEVLVKMASILIKSWTFKNFETGEVFPVTEENITSLYQPDFDYLVKEVSGVLESLNPEKKVLADAEPATGVTEAEKNASSTSSETASPTSESQPSATPA